MSRLQAVKDKNKNHDIEQAPVVLVTLGSIDATISQLYDHWNFLHTYILCEEQV